MGATPAQARERLAFLTLCNETWVHDERRRLEAILEAADEVEETEPAKMIRMAEALERWAIAHDARGTIEEAALNRSHAARYRRCAERAMAVQVMEAA